ncbi:MAG: hypothetical protein QW474_02270 [Candidatus Aenigmatarchaeota archaeon]
MEKWFKKLIGNFLIAFATSYTALVALDSTDRSLFIAFIIAFMQGLLAAGKYLILDEPNTTPKIKKSNEEKKEEYFFVV